MHHLDISRTLTIALFHSLWVGSLIAAVAIPILALLNRASARIRYRWGLVTLLLISASLPTAFFFSAALNSGATGSASASLFEETGPPLAAAKRTSGQEVTELDQEPTAVSGSWNEGRTAREPGFSDTQEGDHSSLHRELTLVHDSRPSQSLSLNITGVAPYLVILYLSGCGILLVRLGIGLWRANRFCLLAERIEDPQTLEIANRLSERAGFKRVPILKLSPEISTPVVVGNFQPVVILPELALRGLSTHQLESLIRHEWAHLRRWDSQICLLQRVLGSFLFYHPAFWYHSRLVSLEREMACDEAVVQEGLIAVDYADSLLKMAELALRVRTGAPVISLAASGGTESELKRRVLNILGMKNQSVLNREGVFMFCIFFLMVALIPWVTVAQAQESEVPPPSSGEPEKQVVDGSLERELVLPKPDPRLLDLPLRLQVSEKSPPVWATSDRETGYFGNWVRGPIFLNRKEILWGPNLVNAVTGESVGKFPFPQEEQISNIRISRDRRFLLVSGLTPAPANTFDFPAPWLEVWDVAKREKQGQRIYLDVLGEADADIADDGETIAIASKEEVSLWKAGTGQKFKTLPVELSDFEKGYQGRPPFFRPEFLKFSPGGDRVVIFSPNHVVYWDWKSTDSGLRVQQAGRRLEEFAFTPDGRYLAEGPGPRTNIHIRDMSSFDTLRTLFDEADSPMITSGLSFTPNGKILIATNEILVDETKLKIPHRIHFWNVKQGSLIRQIATPLYLPRHLDVSPDGTMLAIRLEGNDRTVLAVWTIEE